MSDTELQESPTLTGIDALKNEKYRGKYKGSHKDRGDELGAWFRDQVTDDEGHVELETVLALMEMNGAKEEFIAKRRQWIADNVRGHPGRILMDCRNHLKGLARKSEREGQLKGINGRWSGDAFTLPPKQKAPKRKKKEDVEAA